MGHTFQGIQHNTIYPQPDFVATQSDTGGWTATQSFYLTRKTWDNHEYRLLFARGNSIVLIDPNTEAYHAFLRVATINPVYEEGNIVRVNVNFSGATFGQYSDDQLGAGSQTVYRLEGNISEAPLSEHPKWKALPDNEKSTLGRLIDGSAVYIYDADTAGWYAAIPGTGQKPAALPGGAQLVSADAMEFGKLIAQGQTSYRFPTVTWTESAQGTSPMTSSQLNKLGKISNPRGGPPEASGTRDWMLVSASQEQYGDLYQTNISWELSDKDGWNAFLYQ
jgi:hypothetical protein